MNPAVSIIVPAYNAERHIRRCLDSISVQSFRDYEVLIIDDGSTDTTGQIADIYANQDPRFVVLHKKNGGVSAARQDGIERARGEYTLFVDSDDYISTEALHELFSAAKSNDADLVICDFTLTRKDEKTEYWHQQPDSMDRNWLIGSMLYICPICSKMIRTKCYRAHNIRFEEGINAGEDQLFFLRILAANDTIKCAYVGKALYQYDLSQNSNSISNSGVNASKRLLPLQLFRNEYDITPMQAAFDNAILHIAYDYLKRPDLCPDFKADFHSFRNNIKSAKGFPLYVKLLVLLRLHGIYISVDRLKRVFK
ncbi:MAG: glycosyltransferase family 2 protein [Bacteroidales bacterium]|nr:glycosyltransferase family 2 protein [Bacteroidales bacterium]